MVMSHKAGFKSFVHRSEDLTDALNGVVSQTAVHGDINDRR